MSYNLKQQRIYESPDGGNTVYARIPNMTLRQHRVKIKDDGFTLPYTDFMLRDWDELADKHPAIRDQLEKLKVVVELCNESE